MEQFERTRMLIGNEGLNKLKKSSVAVFGIGGVGGYVVEALARSGVGTIDIIDNDTVNETNINRQIIATHKTLGRYKVDVMKERIEDINRSAIVNTHKCFFLPENSDEFDFSKYSYIVDAIDTVTATIMADGNKDFYMIPSEGGFYFISFTFDPYGKVDYSNAYAHIVDSITIG